MAAEATTAPGDGRLRRDSLQTHLLASHAIVILIALGLVLAISAAFLRRYEYDASRRQLSQLAVPLLAEANVARFGTLAAELRQMRRVDALDAQADAMEMRILVLDGNGAVIYDTDQGSGRRGESLDAYSDIASGLISLAQDDGELHTSYDEPRKRDLFGGERVLVAAGSTGPFPARNAIVMVAEKDRFPLMGLFLPRLVLVAGISLLIASGVALLFSRRLARPVTRLTAAADAMSRGELEQQVPVGGPEEIDRLVRSFNSMSSQVANTHRGQRELLANVAHELRTPLTSVQGYAKAIQDGVAQSDEERDAALTVIGQEAGRMSRLISELLDLARIETGQARLVRRPVPVARLLGETRKRFQPAIDSAGITLSDDVAPDLAVLGDETRLLQVLGNLMSNAIRHTLAGGAIALTARRNEDRILIGVRDTGDGIVPERLPKIFDRFERGEREAGPETGFGLGLAIVRELVELHGGKVEVRSELGRGSEFIIELPSAPPDQPFS